MNFARPGFAALLLAGLGLGPTAGPTDGEPRPIDRWLVSEPFVPDPEMASGGLHAELLDAPGEAGVLPRRGERVAGVAWHLVRRDGSASFPLAELTSEVAGPGAILYAHAYLRLSADATVRLEWRGPECGAARAWLNGRPLHESSARVRLGGGWNTLLLKLATGDCPDGLSAHLEPVDGGELGSVRVQASRPVGLVRTGPADWVVAADTARVDELLRWRGDRLYAGLGFDLTAWGRAPVPDVRLELRDGPDGRAQAPWLVPGERTEAIVPVRLDRLDDVLRAGDVTLRLKWREEEQDRRIAVAGAAPAASGAVALDGWTVSSVAGSEPRESDEGQLPNGRNWVMTGEWKVPDALAGRTLALGVSRSPGDYRVNGSPASGDGEPLLCAPCTRGTTLRVTATSTAAWSAVPVARSTDGS